VEERSTASITEVGTSGSSDAFRGASRMLVYCS
jgi:hypothetical protein